MKIPVSLLMFLLVFRISCLAQTQTITLTATNGFPSSYSCSTGAVISVVSFFSSPNAEAAGGTISFHNGHSLPIKSYTFGENRRLSASGGVGIAFSGNAIFTGVTNIQVAIPPSTFSRFGVLTFTITTPTAQSSIPANAVVIPTDATGPVQIVLESSSDLVNWTTSLPGIYGNTHSNRFFRVRAINQ